MAKKSDFNLSAEVRAMVEANNDITGPEVYAALSKKAKGRKINQNSCGVAFAMARKKLGLTRKRGTKIASRPTSRRVPKPGSDTISLAALRSARELLSRTNGDIATATAVLREVKALQD